ncbi:hypothetical protein P7C73_g678, partial [Tremellales sp. Uapishka_1]
MSEPSQPQTLDVSFLQPQPSPPHETSPSETGFHFNSGTTTSPSDLAWTSNQSFGGGLGFMDHVGHEANGEAPAHNLIPVYPPAMNMSYQPYMLNHTASSSSLASLASETSHHSNNSLFVQSFPSDAHLDNPETLSRTSSFSSLEDKSNVYNNPMGVMDMSVYSVPNGGMYMMPTNSQPKLEVQTQGLGRMVSGRARSASRCTPYQKRMRSESLTFTSEEEDDITSMLSASTTQSYQAPWSATSQSNIAGGFGKMSLHHRRTSSNLSSQAPVRPMLSRQHRSSSLAVARKQSMEQLLPGEIQLTGSASEREETVRADLMTKADEIKVLSTNSQQDKARALWVKRWLVLSYTHSIGSTVPRQGLYHSYTLSCKEYGLKPINSASFGKAVRSAYQGIKTRRLGVRGNRYAFSRSLWPRAQHRLSSKYHYVSIRPAIRIEAERLNEYGDSSGQWHVAPEDGSMGFQSSLNHADIEMGDEEEDEDFDEDEEFTPGTIKKSPSSSSMRSGNFSLSHDRTTSNDVPFQSKAVRAPFARRHTTSALSPFTVEAVQTPVYTLPGFPSVGQALGVGVPMETLKMFWDGFCRHQEILAGCTRSLQFDRFEMNCRNYWTSLVGPMRQCCEDVVISSMVSEALAVSYDNMITILLDKLLLNIPVATQNQLKGLAHNLENVMEQCFSGYSKEFTDDKIELTVRAAHLLSRFVEINQLTQALSPILASQDQVRSMIFAWESLDMKSVTDQCALSCNCLQEVLEGILNDFHRWLIDVENAPNRGGKAIQRLGGWINEVVKDIQGSGNVPLRGLVPRAGFVTSQIVRDFTLKSSPTFGPFQLLKTWVDDWLIIAALRQTALTARSIENASAGNPMTLFIPPASQDMNSMQTAVPNNFGMDFGNATQYLNMPSFEQTMNTPRPFGGDQQQNFVQL